MILKITFIFMFTITVSQSPYFPVSSDFDYSSADPARHFGNFLHVHDAFVPPLSAESAPKITRERVRHALIRSPLTSLRPVAQDLAKHPAVTAAFFLGAGLMAWFEPIPHADKAIMAIGTATALAMLGSGWRAAHRAVAENSTEELNKARLEFGVGAFSLMIVGAVTAGTEVINASGILPALARAANFSEQNTANTVRAVSTLLHFGDEIIWSVMTFNRLKALCERGVAKWRARPESAS